MIGCSKINITQYVITRREIVETNNKHKNKLEFSEIPQKYLLRNVN